MKTLRDEIYNLLDQSARIDSGYYTEEIIKLVEKRIDELIADSERRYELACIQNKTGNPAYFDGEQSSLNDLKEILK
jgi:hypothetical protein